MYRMFETLDSKYKLNVSVSESYMLSYYVSEM